MARVWHRFWPGKVHRDWIADVRDSSGKRHRFSAIDQKEAEELLNEKTNEFKQTGKLLGDPELTLDGYAKGWLAGLPKEGNLKPRTIASYEHLYRRHIAPALGARRLRDLRRTDVKRLLAAKREQVGQNRPGKLSKNTCRLIRATISVMLAEALDDELIEQNPASQLSRKKNKKKKAAPPVLHPFEQDELAKVLEAAHKDDPEYYPLFLLLARTGLRPGEAFALEWDDIDFGKRKIHVERAISDGKLGTTKTDLRRTVDMSQELAGVLQKLRVTREAQTLKHGWGEVPDLVFINGERKYLDISRVRKRFGRAMKQAGVSGHRLYDLRHSFASHLISNNVPITYVSDQLGHTDSVITLKYYARWLPGSGKSYADLLDTPAQFGTKAGTRTGIGGDKDSEADENAA